MQFIWILALGLIGYLAIKYFVRMPGLVLGGKFKKLGNMTGKNKNEIMAVVGKPKAVRNLPDNGQVLVWQASGYMITLIFDAHGKFVKIASETAA